MHSAKSSAALGPWRGASSANPSREPAPNLCPWGCVSTRLTVTTKRGGAKQIAKRASEAAVRDAQAAYADGTAADAASFGDRAGEVKSGGKCWSVDEKREEMSKLQA